MRLRHEIHPHFVDVISCFNLTFASKDTVALVRLAKTALANGYN